MARTTRRRDERQDEQDLRRSDAQTDGQERDAQQRRQSDGMGRQQARREDPEQRQTAPQRQDDARQTRGRQEQTQGDPMRDEAMRRQQRGVMTGLSSMGAMPGGGMRPQAMGGMGMASMGSMPPEAMTPKITEAELGRARDILQKYKAGKASLEARIVANEEWYKLHNWQVMPGKAGQVQPTSAYLFNAVANKHADAMDSFPAPNILPREEGDKYEAEMLSDIVPVIMDQCDFEQVYSEVWDYKLKNGTGIYAVYWDKTKLNGLGDVAIRKIDALNLFWEPGITDIQRSRHLFNVELVDNEALVGMYPQLAGRLSTPELNLAQYIYDDAVDTSDKSCVIDWYYKQQVGGKSVLHYVKFVANEVLFATENDPNFAERGLYDHGLYPFVFDTLFSVEGSPFGFGFIDVGKSAQEYIDRGNAAMLQNMLANARPRHFIRNDGAVNEAEYADLTNDFVHVDGSLGTDSIIPIPVNSFPSIYQSVIEAKIAELKEVTGNRDVATGGTTSGVTAASAIAALQEAGSKLSRDSIRASYRAYRLIVNLVIELIRQFYDVARSFRIAGADGVMRFVQYSNAGISAQQIPRAFGGMDVSYRVPQFDIEVTAEKQSAYSKLSQNELALQFYQLGFFNPALADQSLICLDMMDFDRKDMVIQKVQQLAIQYQLAMQLQAAAGMMPEEDDGSEPQQGGKADLARTSQGAQGKKESSVTENARKQVDEQTQPR